jgi:hypothetical protein
MLNASTPREIIKTREATINSTVTAVRDREK